jgi:predicted nucleotidyltransferase
VYTCDIAVDNYYLKKRLQLRATTWQVNTMIKVSTLVSDHIDAVRRLCAEYHVRRLELFGSATNERFDSAASDLDFLVEFEQLAPVKRADAYFGLLAALQDLFQRKIDLVESEAINNPFFQKIVDQQRTVLYDT